MQPFDFDAIIIGSGAGGGPVAYELTRSGKNVALIEAGGFYTTNDFNRFELDQIRKLWEKPRWTSNHELGLSDEISLGMGKSVGGSTTIFTAVAARAPEFNFKEWHEASGVVNEAGAPITLNDLRPFYEEVERDSLVRKYTEWDEGLKKINEGFQKLDHPFTPVNAYVTMQCDKSGCLFGCPTEAKRGTLVTYVIPAVLEGLQVFYNSKAKRILFAKESAGPPRAVGVEIFDGNSGELRRLYGRIIILSAGALCTPFLLWDSGIEEVSGHSKSSRQVGRNFACNTAAMVFGKFEEVLNNWQVHPLSGHMDEFCAKEKGGFLLEGSSVLEGPLGFAEVCVDEDGVPLLGERQKKVMKDYGRYAGIFINIHDQNDGRIFRDPATGKEKFYKPVSAPDRARFSKARSLCREGMFSAGAKETLDTIFMSHHVQGSCRMGGDSSLSVVDSNLKSHDIDSLYIADGSVIPSVIDVNPSLTIMALSKRLAKHLLSHELAR